MNPELKATTTPFWPGEDPRQAVSGAMTALAEAYPPIPLTSTRALETRHAVDLVGYGTTLLDGLPVDFGPFGWRLSRGTGRDMRRERSRRTRVVDALGEYAQGFATPLSWWVAGPWTLVRSLSLLDGNPVLGDPGAVRDVVQAYAFGVAGRLAEFTRLLGIAPRVAVFESGLDEIVQGRVPTASGYRTLPALSDTQVAAGLRSFLARCGDDPLFVVPGLGSVHIRGKDVTHRSLFAEAGAGNLVVPVPRTSAGWEELATAFEDGVDMWAKLPGGLPAAGVNRALDMIRKPWTGIGMSPGRLPELGIVTGWDMPTADPPVLPAAASAESAIENYRLAARVGAAVKELS